MTIEQFDRNASTTDVVAAMDRDGAAIVRDQIDSKAADLICEELRNCFDALEHSKSRSTILANVLFDKSPAAVELTNHPRVTEIADAILLQYCLNYQLGAASAIEIRAGAEAQNLCADVAIYPMRLPGVEWLIGAVWAMDDLGEDNGAPLLIPGSHRGDRMRRPNRKDMVPAPMPGRSVLLYMGWTLRGWGANCSDADSVLLVNRYSLGWLRPEDDYFLSLPGENFRLG